MKLLRHFLASMALGLTALASVGPACAQGEQPIRIIYPFPAGGAGDSIIRLLAERKAIHKEILALGEETAIASQ